MKSTVNRQTIDLSEYPDLVVIYLGMRINALRGLKAAARLGPQIAKAVADKPDGLLLHENIFFSIFPLHSGMRQYWRDFDSLERWSRSLPHQKWWHDFLRDSSGTGFWHETYFMRGGMEAIYDDMPKPTGMMAFARAEPARGALFTARKRVGLDGEETLDVPVKEEEYYGRK